MRHIDRRDWTPLHRMNPTEREEYETFRDSLEPGSFCLSCMDAGLPCYHIEPEGTDEVVSFLAVLDCITGPDVS